MRSQTHHPPQRLCEAQFRQALFVPLMESHSSQRTGEPGGLSPSGSSGDGEAGYPAAVIAFVFPRISRSNRKLLFMFLKMLLSFCRIWLLKSGLIVVLG